MHTFIILAFANKIFIIFEVFSYSFDQLLRSCLPSQKGSVAFFAWIGWFKSWLQAFLFSSFMKC